MAQFIRQLPIVGDIFKLLGFGKKVPKKYKVAETLGFGKVTDSPLKRGLNKTIIKMNKKLGLDSGGFAMLPLLKGLAQQLLPIVSSAIMTKLQQAGKGELPLTRKEIIAILKKEDPKKIAFMMTAKLPKAWKDNPATASFVYDLMVETFSELK